MINITINGVAHELAQKWDEVPQEQLPKFVELLFMRAETGETYHEILRISLGYSEKKWKKWIGKFFSKDKTEDEKQTSALALQELLKHLSWMWTKPMSKRPAEYIHYKGVYLYLPVDDFLTMSWGEMKDAYIHAEAFTRQIVKGDKHLNLLVLTLCREKSKEKRNFDWDGDERVPYNEFLVAEKEEWIESLEYSFKLAVLLYFVGTMKKLLDQYDIFYDNSDSTSLIPYVEQYPGQGFEDNTLMLAEKQLFGNYKQTTKVNCHQVLLALERNKKIMEMEMEAQKQSSNS